MIAKNSPDGWTAEESKSYGVVIEAPGVDGGCVTVDENARNFLLGVGLCVQRAATATAVGTIGFTPMPLRR